MPRFAPFFLISSAAAALAAPTPDQLEFFETKVRPVLAEQCYKCHGPEKQKGALRIDSLAAMLKGNDDGPVIVPGKPDESTLIKSIKHVGESKMPEKAPKMPDDQIAAIEHWVAIGAPWPEIDKPTTAGAVDTAKTHWSYQPMREVVPPEVKDPKMPIQNPIDAFILARLDEAGIAPSPKADKRTLLRRASFAITGLPPTNEEVAALEGDASPDAFEKAVDRLLASPRYGERWARHWMDVARYSDSKGYMGVGVDRSYPFAYTYRDWLIHAFNADLPYDRFLQLQLAADSMVGPNDPDLAAMGFLTVGRRFIGNQNDIIDDRIDTLTRGTMGLTVACARCHDHKFDPLAQRDYYSMYGVFNSSFEPDDLPQIGEVEDKEAFARYEEEVAKKRGELEAFQTGLSANYSLVVSLSAGVPVAVARLDREALKGIMTGKDRERSRDLAAAINKVNNTGASPPRAMVFRDKPQPVEPHIFIRGNPGRQGDLVPRAFIAVLSGGKPEPFKKGSGRLELAQSIASPTNPLTARHIVNRVWSYHFGKGLVRTPGDFGVKGDPPTHPELLDFLATRLIAEGWSLKKLHRFILTSSAWQQVGDMREDAAQKDPENRLLWRQNRQRLDFEALRDSLLACAGQLDLKIGGKTVDIINPPYSKRRAVYANIDRQNLPGTFRTFDFPSPDVSNPQRHVTTVPQQALFMLNSPFVIEQARSLVAKPEFSKPESGSEWQVQNLYERVYARHAEPSEVDAALKFLSGEASRAAEAPEQPLWQFGHGFYDAAAKRVNFTPFKDFVEKRWQCAPKLPDPELGHILLSDAGGHTGRDQQHAAIRRWTAPRDAVVSIKGSLARPAEAGDGVEAIVVSSRAGELARVVAGPKATVEVKADAFEVKAGDILDFLVDCRANDNSDSFTWTISIETEGAAWNSRAGFRGPLPPRPTPLSAWEKYAQVLLETNEFVFVD